MSEESTQKDKRKKRRFMAILFTPGIFARNLRLISDLNSGLTSNKLTHTLLVYGDTKCILKFVCTISLKETLSDYNWVILSYLLMTIIMKNNNILLDINKRFQYHSF